MNKRNYDCTQQSATDVFNGLNKDIKTQIEKADEIYFTSHEKIPFNSLSAFFLLFKNLGLGKTVLLQNNINLIPEAFKKINVKHAEKNVSWAVLHLYNNLIIDKKQISLSKFEKLYDLAQTSDTFAAELVVPISKSKTAYLAPPINDCGKCHKKLTAHQDPTEVKIFNLKGVSCGYKCNLRCRACNSAFGYSSYSNGKETFSYQHSELSKNEFVEASNRQYISKDLLNWFISLWLV